MKIFFHIAFVVTLHGSAIAVPATLEFFNTPGCVECERVKHEVLASVSAAFGEWLDMREYNLDAPRAYSRLAYYRDRLARPDQAASAAAVVVDGVLLFETPDLLSPRFNARLASHVAQRLLETAPAELAPDMPEAGLNAIRQAFQTFTLPGVALAGLVDGMNPCAISALVFLASVLAVSRRRRRDMLRMGAAFCAAAYATYFLIGLGAFGALRRLDAIQEIRDAMPVALSAVLLVFAILSMADAIRFAKTRQPGSLFLKLPDRLKIFSQRVMRERMTAGGVVTGGLCAGFLTTLVESVCTSQVYAPVLAVLARLRGDTRALVWLGVYNLMFILPLAAVLVAFLAGARVSALTAWSARHAVLAKWCMALFFLLLALATWFGRL